MASAAAPRRAAAAAAGPATDTGTCLSLHQPWASLLVYGIKRIEGRGWPTEHRGRLWIAATAKQPTEQEVEEMETFYRAVHGTSPDFPAAYPAGVLLGCVDVVGCLQAEQVEAWEALPEGLRAEVGSPYCFLCQAPQRLVVPQQMRGWPKLFQLEKKLHKVAQLGLRPAPNSKGFAWAAFGEPPASDAALPPSRSKHKYRELQQRMDAARASSSDGLQSLEARAEADAEERHGRPVAKTASCQSPRAAAAAAAGLPRAVALQQAAEKQQQQQQQQQQAQQQIDPQKRLRAVQKKLRQIAALEEKRGVGQALQPEEVAKLAQRAQLEAEVAALTAAGAAGAP